MPHPVALAQRGAVGHLVDDAADAPEPDGDHRHQAEFLRPEDPNIALVFAQALVPAHPVAFFRQRRRVGVVRIVVVKVIVVGALVHPLVDDRPRDWRTEVMVVREPQQNVEQGAAYEAPTISRQGPFELEHVMRLARKRVLVAFELSAGEVKHASVTGRDHHIPIVAARTHRPCARLQFAEEELLEGLKAAFGYDVIVDIKGMLCGAFVLHPIVDGPIRRCTVEPRPTEVEKVDKPLLEAPILVVEPQPRFSVRDIVPLLDVEARADAGRDGSVVEPRRKEVRHGFLTVAIGVPEHPPVRFGVQQGVAGL